MLLYMTLCLLALPFASPSFCLLNLLSALIPSISCITTRTAVSSSSRVKVVLLSALHACLQASPEKTSHNITNLVFLSNLYHSDLPLVPVIHNLTNCVTHYSCERSALCWIPYNIQGVIIPLSQNPADQPQTSFAV